MKKIKYLSLILAMVLMFSFNISAKSDVVVKNNSNQIVKVTKYHSNNRMSYIESRTYDSNKKLAKRLINNYNTNGQITGISVITYYANGKTKEVSNYSNYYKNNYRNRVISQYNQNGVLKYREYLYKNNSFKNTQVKRYYYSNQGNLKSNKNSTASRVVFAYYSNGKAKSKTTHNYTYAGKLTNRKVVTYPTNAPGYVKPSTSIEVNIAKQKLYLYSKGKLIMTSDIVTGLPSAGWSTPKGRYTIAYKTTNFTLDGSSYGFNYRLPVKYWMPLNNGGGVGFHDANWRGAGTFGGSYYKSSGSHGCINMKTAEAKKLYQTISAGTPVWIH